MIEQPETRTIPKDLDRQLTLAAMILEARQLALGWTDSKAQNLITACSILMAIIGFPVLGGTGGLSVYVKAFMLMAGIATLTSLLMALLVTRFRMPFSWWRAGNESPRTLLVTIAGSYHYFRKAGTRTQLSQLIGAYTREIEALAKDQFVESYAEAIALDTAIAVSKVRFLNLAIWALQIGVALLGMAVVLHFVGV